MGHWSVLFFHFMQNSVSGVYIHSHYAYSSERRHKSCPPNYRRKIQWNVINDDVELFACNHFFLLEFPCPSKTQFVPSQRRSCGFAYKKSSSFRLSTITLRWVGCPILFSWTNAMAATNSFHESVLFCAYPVTVQDFSDLVGWFFKPKIPANQKNLQDLSEMQ